MPASVISCFKKQEAKEGTALAREIFVTPQDCLQEVFDNARENDTLRLAAGIYRQKAVIRVPHLTVIGAGKDKTRIVYGDYALKKDAQGRELVTFRTYTLAVCADHVKMERLNIANDALEPHVKGQEVALSVCGDDFRMAHCALSSTQDTLFIGPLPPDLVERYDGFLPDELRGGAQLTQRFEHCLIEGTVDFIFGCGAAVFDRCVIRSLYDARGVGYVAAPAHPLSQKKGFLFRNCRLTRARGVANGSVFLARPWRDYGLCRFENCVYGRHIAAAGFDKWNDSRRDLTARFEEFPAVEGRVSWVNRAD